jgi:tRNA/rRNA methyltransferase
VTNPVVILVNTQLPENIGAAARAMKNFGLSELRLVAPRDAFPNKRAYDLAAHAADIIDSAKIFATTREAVADLERVYASTARPREMVKTVYSPQKAVVLMEEEKLPTGILFGPERTGLTNDDVALCDAIITIPTAEMASLNIAQSVVVLAYEWFRMGGTLPPSALHADSPAGSSYRTPPGDHANAGNLVHKSEFASKEELQGFFDHLERRLDEKDFWKVSEKKQKMWLNLQNIFARASLTEQEVRTLHGVIASLGEE